MHQTNAIHSSTPSASDRRSTAASPQPADATQFEAALDAAAPIETRPQIEGDLDHDGSLSIPERFVIALKNHMKQLREQLAMQELSGNLSADQRDRLMRGIVALGRLAANVEDRIKHGEDVPILEVLRPQATDILFAATSDAPADEEPRVRVPMPRDAERAYEHMQASTAQRIEHMLAS